MVVMEECHRQIQEVAGKQKDKVDELSAEIRKLKAMIGGNILYNKYYMFLLICVSYNAVKHETRIRSLETKNKEQEKQLLSAGIVINNNGHNEDLDPDEV